MCKKTLFTRNFTLQLRASRKHNFYPCLDEIQYSKEHSGTRFHPTRLHSGEDKKFQLHIGRKKKRRILKICYMRPFDLPCMTFENTVALKVARSDFSVTIPFNFERLEHHHYQSIKKSNVSGKLEKDESFK